MRRGATYLPLHLKPRFQVKGLRCRQEYMREGEVRRLVTMHRDKTNTPSIPPSQLHIRIRASHYFNPGTCKVSAVSTFLASRSNYRAQYCAASKSPPRLDIQGGGNAGNRARSGQKRKRSYRQP